MGLECLLQLVLMMGVVNGNQPDLNLIGSFPSSCLSTGAKESKQKTLQESIVFILLCCTLL